MKRIDIANPNQLPKNQECEMLIGSYEDCTARFAERYPWLANVQVVYVVPPGAGWTLPQCYFPMKWKGEKE